MILSPRPNTQPSSNKIRSNQIHRPRSHCSAATIGAKRFWALRGIGVLYFAIIRGIFEVTMRHRQSGFTLIEIMVVVVILAVVGALVVPNILGKVDTARITAAKTDIRSIGTALDLYRLDNFKYPTTEQGLQALVKQPADPSLTNYNPFGYFKPLPNDPGGSVF